MNKVVLRASVLCALCTLGVHSQYAQAITDAEKQAIIQDVLQAVKAEYSKVNVKYNGIALGDGEITNETDKTGNIYIGGEQNQKLIANNSIVIGYENNLNDPTTAPTTKRLRDTMIMGHKNTITKVTDDNDGQEPINSIAYGYGNTLKGSYAVAFGLKNTVQHGKNSSEYAWVIGANNNINASAYVMGDRNHINTLPNYDLDQIKPHVGSMLYVLGWRNIIGTTSAAPGSTIADTGGVNDGAIIGNDNIIYTRGNHVLGQNNKVHAFDSVALGEANRIGIDGNGKPHFRTNNQGKEGNLAPLHTVAIGNGNYVQDSYGMAIGSQTQSIGKYAISIGTVNKAQGIYDTALGHYNTTSGDGGAVAVGYRTHATAEFSTSIGAYNNYDPKTKKIYQAGFASSAIGNSNKALADYAGAFGAVNTSAAKYSFAAGNWNTVTTTSKRGQAFGYQNVVNGYGAIAFGAQNNLFASKPYLMDDFQAPALDQDGFIESGELSVAIGTGNVAYGNNSVAVGRGSYAMSSGALAIGGSAVVDGSDSIAIGTNSHVHANTTTKVSTVKNLNSAIAIGTESQAAADFGIALGAYSKAVEGLHAGYNPQTKAIITNAEMATYQGDATKGAQIATLTADANQKRDAYLAAKADALNTLHRIQTEKWANNDELKALQEEYKQKNTAALEARKAWQTAQSEVGKWSAPWQATENALSIGNAEMGLTRQITGVAAGTNDTDAVNVAQLKAVVAGATGASDMWFFRKGTMNNGHYVPSTNTADKWSNQRIAFGTGLTAQEIQDDAGNKYTEISATITAGQDGKSAYQIWESYTKDDGTQPNKGKTEADFMAYMKGTNGTDGTNGAPGKSAFDIWKDYTAADGSQPNKNKSEADFMEYMKGKDAPGTDFIVKADKAAADGQKPEFNVNKDKAELSIVGDSSNITTTVADNNTVKISLNDNIAVKKVTAGLTTISDDGVSYDGHTYIGKDGLNANDKKITNVLAGDVSKDSKDAINGSQLFATNEAVKANSEQITNLNQTISHIGSEIADVRDESHKGDAMNAALAALKPLDFDPLQRSQIMAGVSTYQGKQAIALGLAHYKNEDTLIHGGISYGGSSDLMANLGISWRFGDKKDRNARAERLPQYAGGPISSVYVMQDEMVALQDKNKAAEARIAELEAHNKASEDRIAALEKQVQALLNR